MAKIKLGSRPKNFPRTIKFPMLDGTVGSIDVVYKYRTRSEYAEFLDKRMEDARATNKAEEAAEKAESDALKASGLPEKEFVFSLSDNQKKADATNVSFVLDVVESWNLDVQFDKEAVEQLCDELPAGLQAIIENYRAAITEGRSGN